MQVDTHDAGYVDLNRDVLCYTRKPVMDRCAMLYIRAQEGRSSSMPLQACATAGLRAVQSSSSLSVTISDNNDIGGVLMMMMIMMMMTTMTVMTNLTRPASAIRLNGEEFSLFNSVTGLRTAE